MNFLDLALLRRAIKGPGTDTRSWVSYGIIAEDSPDSHSVRFNDEEGAPFPEGPLVSVVLHPSGIPVTCRVGMGVAGAGEAEWTPFVQGDEVLICLPDGNTHAGPVIVARFSNELKTFPATVAGQDATTNTFAFKRMRTPYILETSASYLVRSAVTGAQFGIDQTGNVIFNDGEGSRFFMSADVVGMSTADGSESIQMLAEKKQVVLTAGGVTSLLLDAAVSVLTTSGTLSIGTSGLGVLPGGALQHAVTAEQVINIISNVLTQLATLGVFKTGSPFDATPWTTIPGTAVAAINALWATVLPALGTPTPFGTLGAPGGLLGPIAPSLAALIAAISNPIPSQDITGMIPGAGRSGFMY